MLQRKLGRRLVPLFQCDTGHAIQTVQQGSQWGRGRGLMLSAEKHVYKKATISCSREEESIDIGDFL